MRNRDQEQLTRRFEETLSAEGQKRWALLANLASEHGYELEDRYAYRHDGDYLMKIGRTVIYLRDMADHEYKEVRKSLEERERIATSPSVIGNALTIGGSALGGGFLGYLLIRAGLHPLVLIPSIIIPPSVGIYEMLKQSSKESKKLAKIDVSLEKYRENIFYDDDAIRGFLYKIHKKAHQAE